MIDPLESESPVPTTKRLVRLLFLGDPRLDRRINSFANAFSAAGWRVQIVCGVTRATEVDRIHSDVEIIPIRITSLHGPMRFVEYHRKLRAAFINDSPCDLVVACDLYSLGVAALLKRRGLAKLAIFDSREVYTELPSIAERPLVKWIWKMFEHSGLARMDAMLVTGSRDLTAIFAIHQFSPRPFLVRNVPERVTEIHPDRTLRSRFGIAEGSTLFIYVGGIQKGRGLEQFINAFRSSTATNHFLIIGEGPERERLETLVAQLQLSSRVHFLGGIAARDVLSLLAAADVGVSLIEPLSLSYEYALPSKLFEYMMAGLVTLTSPLVHVLELFRDEPWLVTANPNSESEIISAIKKSEEVARLTTTRTRARELSEAIYNFESEIIPFMSFVEARLSDKFGAAK